MPSKRSCFNRTLFRKNLSRTWPLWGLLSVVGAMMPLYFLVELLRYPAAALEPREFGTGLYRLAAGFVPGFTAFYALLCAMLVWGYLYNARSAGLMHTLPVDRTCLFVTNALSGLVMIVIPYAVTGALLCLTALIWGFFDVAAVVNTVLAVLFCAVLFSGMAALCAMLTGHGFVMPVFYLLANFLAFFLEALITSLAEEFLLGVGMAREIGMLGFLSPVIQIYSSFQPRTEYSSNGTDLFSVWQEGLWVVALYALVGLALLVLAWLLYKRRHSESAGDVVAFRWLRPVFRYGVALLSALTVGRVLFELFWVPLFQRGYYFDRIPMGVCLFLGGLLGYYIASMLLEKTLRVFRGSWKGVLIVAAGAAAVCLLVSVDVFGLERKIPPLEEIESVSLRDQGVESGPFTAEDSPEVIARLRELHQSIVNDRSYIRNYTPNREYEEGLVYSHFVRLTYRLKDGSTLERHYDLWLSRERVATPGTYDNLLAEFYQDPAVKRDSAGVPAGSELESVGVICGYGEAGYVNANDRADGEKRESWQIYAALQKDAAEGNIPGRDVLQFSTPGDSSFFLELEYLTWNQAAGAYYGHVSPVYMVPSMTNTIDTLVELGYVTRQELAEWERAWTQQRAEDAGSAPAEVVPAIPAE